MRRESLIYYEPGITTERRYVKRPRLDLLARRLDLRQSRLGHVRRVEVDGDALQRALDGLLRAGVLPARGIASMAYGRQRVASQR